MKEILCLTILLVIASCGETDNKRRTPDARFSTQGCINDSTEQELFDENGNVYYEYVSCPDEQSEQENQLSQKSPCVNDSMEQEQFDDQGNAFYVKVPCP